MATVRPNNPHAIGQHQPGANGPGGTSDLMGKGQGYAMNYRKHSIYVCPISNWKNRQGKLPKPGPCSTLWKDTFGGSAGFDIHTHPTDTGQTWAAPAAIGGGNTGILLTGSNSCEATPASGGGEALLTQASPKADVTLTGYWIRGDVNSDFSLCARDNNDPSGAVHDFIQFGFLATGLDTGQLILDQFQGTPFIEMDLNLSYGVVHRFKLVVTGSTAKGYVDDVLMLSESGFTLAAPGHVGMIVQQEAAGANSVCTYFEACFS